MFNEVLTSIQSFGSFTPSELSLFESKLTSITVTKNDFIIKEGQTCQDFYFIMEGSCIHYFPADDGTDHILNLYVRNNWLTEYQSFITQKGATACIQAFEDCQLAVMNINAFHELMQTALAFFQIGKLLDNMRYSDYAAQFKSPEEKYLDLLDRRPALIQTFPLKLLASYLHIAPETLSRIRKRVQ
ncbi:MAG: Crp/Fnr family transcriptional regulator [Chitinophagaceae bacterium]